MNGTTTTPERAAGPRDAEAFRLHAELCKVFTDPKRLMVLEALRAGECSVGELAGMVGMSLPNASQHLSVLRHAGLVATRRDGTTVFYTLAEPRIAQACDIVHQIVLDRMPEARSPARTRLPRLGKPVRAAVPGAARALILPPTGHAPRAADVLSGSWEEVECRSKRAPTTAH